MVNTFLVDLDFRKSAAKLDRARLGKQRVEAQQILNTCESLHTLAKLFGLPEFPRETQVAKEARSAWIRSIAIQFKQLGCAAIALSARGLRTFYKKDDIPRRLSCNERLIQDGQLYHVYDLTKKKYVASGTELEFIHPFETFISIGYVYHSAVSMWIGFESALKDYINAHIEVWIGRGYNNTMPMHSVTYPIVSPWWCTHETVKMFQGSLLERELQRGEAPWYIHQREFILSFCHSEEMAVAISSQMMGPTSFTADQLLTLSKVAAFVWP